MTIDKAKLKALAEAAYSDLLDWRPDFGLTDEQERFSMSASPTTILALLEEIERLGEDPSMRAIRALSGDCAELIGERDKLRAELAGLRTGYDAQNNVIEGLRLDAENWQTVRRAMDQLKSDEQGAAIWSACSRILISLASDLNSARSVVTEEGVTKDGADIGDWRVTVERLAIAKEASQ